MWQKKEGVPHLVDHVGNLLQEGGGIVPKACQVCKVEFDAPTQEVVVTESAPSYKCSKCPFFNTSADYAWDHEKANPDHKVVKSSLDRIVGYKNIIVGKKAHITIIKGETHVTCEGCINGISKS